MRVMIAYLSCGCVVWLSSRTVITVNGHCPRCGQEDVDSLAHEDREVGR